MDADREKEFEALASRVRALSNGRRLAVLSHLRRPRYLEEIASFLKMSRQAAQEHMAVLLEAGLVEKHAGQRESGPVVEYRLVRPQLFALFEDLRTLGTIVPEGEPDDALLRTRMGAPKALPDRGDTAEVVVVGGFRPGLATPLHRGAGAPPLVVGRDPSCGLVIDWDLLVSNRHAEIRPQAKGHVLVDLFSRNGTFVNERHAAGGEAVPLRSGDLVHVGRTVLVYRD